MEPFLQSLRKNENEQQEITLLNIYKGVPIAYSATILAVSQAAVQLRTERYQIVCLYRERETFVQSSLFPYLVRARVAALDIPRLETVLTGFEIVRSRIGARTHVRVQPKDPIQGEIRSRALLRSTTAELADVSQNGVGIFIPERAFVSSAYALNTELRVSFRLPGEYQVNLGTDLDQHIPSLDRYSPENVRPIPIASVSKASPENDLNRRRFLHYPEIELKGAITNIRLEERYHRYRIGIQMTAGDGAKLLLAQFISQRQSEIIREIRDAYELLAKGDQPST